MNLNFEIISNVVENINGLAWSVASDLWTLQTTSFGFKVVSITVKAENPPL
jgi:hypothetical protein